MDVPSIPAASTNTKGHRQVAFFVGQVGVDESRVCRG